MGRRVLYHRATRFPQLFDLCAHSVTSAATPWTVARQAPLSLGILQAKILEWVAMLSSRGSSHPGIKPASLASAALAGGFFTVSAAWEAHV